MAGQKDRANPVKHPDFQRGPIIMQFVIHFMALLTLKFSRLIQYI